MNSVEVTFLNIHSGNFELLHYRILKFFPLGVFRSPISSTYSLREILGFYKLFHKIKPTSKFIAAAALWMFSLSDVTLKNFWSP